MKCKAISAPENWRRLKAHAYAEISEFGLGIDLDGLVTHMSQFGWDASERITLIEKDGEWQILDGRHKHDAAQKAEVEPLFQLFHGTDAEAIAFVQKKLLRQHLDASQRAMVASRLSGLSQPKAAEALNVSERLVDLAKIVQQKCSPAVQRAVRTGIVTVTDAAIVAKEAKAKQDAALQKVRDGKAKSLKEGIGGKKKKLAPKPKHPELPRSVQDALADTWHADIVAECERRKKETIAAANWSRWLDVEEAVRLWTALREIYATAVPTKPCPECKGLTKIDGKQCTRCDGCGYLGSQC